MTINESFYIVRLCMLRHEECYSALQGETVIFGASVLGHPTSVTTLLSHGANVAATVKVTIAC